MIGFFSCLVLSKSEIPPPPFRHFPVSSPHLRFLLIHCYISASRALPVCLPVEISDMLTGEKIGSKQLGDVAQKEVWMSSLRPDLCSRHFPSPHLLFHRRIVSSTETSQIHRPDGRERVCLMYCRLVCVAIRVSGVLLNSGSA